MKKIKIDRRTIYIFAIFLLIIMFLALKMFNSDKKGSSNYQKYESNIVINVVDRSDQVHTYTIDIVDDGENAMANLNYLNVLVYMSKGKLLYNEFGRHKRVNSLYTYRDIYNILNEIKTNQEGNFNVTISKEIANKIFSSLFIDYKFDKDIAANMTIENEKITAFSLHLSNIRDFKKMNVSISFSDLDKDYKIEKPIFYDAATDVVGDEKFKI